MSPTRVGMFFIGLLCGITLQAYEPIAFPTLQDAKAKWDVWQEHRAEARFLKEHPEYQVPPSPIPTPSPSPSWTQ